MNDRDDDDYEVGYGKPPKHTRFKPGQSGNPKGRPKGTRNFKTDVKAMLNAPVRITRNGKPRKVSTQEAGLLCVRERALSGHAKELGLLLDLAKTFNSEELTVTSALSADDTKLLELFMQRVKSGVVAEPSGSEVSEPSSVSDPASEDRRSTAEGRGAKKKRGGS
jgi:hypothetical protein